MIVGKTPDSRCDHFIGLDLVSGPDLDKYVAPLVRASITVAGMFRGTPHVLDSSKTLADKDVHD